MRDALRQFWVSLGVLVLVFGAYPAYALAPPRGSTEAAAARGRAAKDTSDRASKPPKSDAKPPRGGAKPAKSDAKPSRGGAKPAKEEGQPSQVEGKPPRGGAKPPKAEGKPPRGGTKPPKAGAKPPKVGAKPARAGASASAEAAGAPPGRRSRAKADDKGPKADEARFFYGTPQKGDTFASFARRFRTTTGQIRRLNNLARARTLPVGQRLKVREKEFAIRGGAPADPRPPRVEVREGEFTVHKVKKGDTLGSIADRYNVRVADIVKLNGLKRRPSLRKGMILKVKKRPDAVLVGGVSLPASEHLYRRTRPDASWGTPGTIALIHDVYAAFRQLHPYSVPGVIADISRSGGGFFPPHKSHRRGVDADVGYFKVGNEPLKYLEVVEPDTIDVIKVWDLIRLFLNTGHVSVIFMDIRLQGTLYDHLKALGYDRELLDVLLQYPRGIGEQGGLIRHSPGHHHHLHVRFDCVDANAPCHPSPVALIPDAPRPAVAAASPADPVRPAPRSALEILRARARLHVVEGDEDEVEGELGDGGSAYVDHAATIEDAEGERLHGAALDDARGSVWGAPGGGPMAESEPRPDEVPERCTRFGCERTP